MKNNPTEIAATVAKTTITTVPVATLVLIGELNKTLDSGLLAILVNSAIT